MRRTARLAIHGTNAVRSSSPRIAPGCEAGAAGAASNLINVGAASSIDSPRWFRARTSTATNADAAAVSTLRARASSRATGTAQTQRGERDTSRPLRSSCRVAASRLEGPNRTTIRAPSSPPF